MDKTNHPIAGLMETAMENIKKMVEVNTVVGDAVETKNGTVIIPVTKITCGFAAGGSQFSTQSQQPLLPSASAEENETFPFGGGSGGGISVQPIGFLVVKDQEVRFQVVDNNAIFDRVLDQVPGFIQQIKESFGKKSSNDSGMDQEDKNTTETIETIIKTTTVNLEGQ